MLQRGRNPLRLILPRCEAGERVYVVLSIRPSEPASPGVVPPDLDRSALPALISFRRLPDDDET
jgi:hypothetical protein